jgi:hypothetical protein
MFQNIRKPEWKLRCSRCVIISLIERDNNNRVKFINSRVNRGMLMPVIRGYNFIKLGIISARIVTKGITQRKLIYLGQCTKEEKQPTHSQRWQQ